MPWKRAGCYFECRAADVTAYMPLVDEAGPISRAEPIRPVTPTGTCIRSYQTACRVRKCPAFASLWTNPAFGGWLHTFARSRTPAQPRLKAIGPRARSCSGAKEAADNVIAWQRV